MSEQQTKKAAPARIGAGYIRVSTDKQEELSPDAQKRLLYDYAKSNNILLPPEHIFMESGISGRKADKRPEFMRMIATAKSKEHPFDVILVWKYSRFARNQEESIVYKSLLQKNKVEVISISEPLIDGPFGSLVERIIEWMDEYYSIRLAGEVTRGMTEKALRGGYQAQPPMGYSMDKATGIPVPNSQASFVCRVYDSFLNRHMSFREIAMEANALGYRTRRGKPFEERAIRYILENPFYCGMIRWNRQDHATHTIKDKDQWIIVPGRHAPIVTKELWDSVQEQIIARNRPQRAHSTGGIKHWLSGVIKCSACGSSLMYQRAQNGFQCGNYLRGSCNVSHYIPAARLEEALLSAMQDIYTNPGSTLNYIIRNNSGHADDIQAMLTDQLNKLATKERRIKQAYRDGIDTLEEYKENKLVLADERNALLEQLSKLQKTPADGALLMEKIKNACEVIRTSNDFKVRTDILRSVIDKVVYDKQQDTLQILFYLSK